MKRLLRILTLCLALSVVGSIFLASPFAEQVWADSCWYGCTDGPQRNRSGCSVRFAGYVGDNNEFGNYKYTCGNQTINCFYKYNCESGGGGELLLE